MRLIRTPRIAGAFFASVLAVVFASSSHGAVIWDLNPSNQNAPVGSSNHTYTSGGFSITAYGFDNHSGIGTAHDLFYKSEGPIGGASEIGLGLVNTPSNELQANLHFIQFDITSLVAAHFDSLQMSVGSVQPNETFQVFGSNALGTLGAPVTQIFGSSFDNQFINIPNFGTAAGFNFYSVMALSDDVLPVALKGAESSQVPEIDALLPICALLILLCAANVWRRRRHAA